ncbi:MAG: FAD-binding oxidoreductase [Pseudomonadota bacterium]
MTYDVAIIGGGIMGLWAARHALDAGLTTVVVEADRCGAGASGTVLGALLPHLPRSMSAKKAFQFAALAELSGLVARLEADTGRAAGYARCGRIMPVRTERFRASVETAIAEAKTHWRTDHTANTPAFDLTLQDAAAYEGWISPDEAPLGVLHDTLSARALSEDYIAALAADVRARGTLIEATPVCDIDLATGRLHGVSGSLDIAADTIVVAAGVGSFSLLQRVTGNDFGGGVKGQAAVIEIEAQPTSRPVLYDNGVYVVPHSPTRCAIGSTSEMTYDDPRSAPPAAAAAFIERASALCPAIARGTVVAHWAGVRPRCAAKEPIVGEMSHHSSTQNVQLWALTGGYKISFGIAHRLARRLIEEVTDADVRTEIPESYSASYHLAHVRTA